MRDVIIAAAMYAAVSTQLKCPWRSNEFLVWLPLKCSAMAIEGALLNEVYLHNSQHFTDATLLSWVRYSIAQQCTANRCGDNSAQPEGAPVQNADYVIKPVISKAIQKTTQRQ